jgi:cell pole-organizing protein PopZ
MSSKTAAVPEPNDDNEPSMEEILASIRKIIADDSLGTKKNEPMPKKAPVVKAPEPEPEPDIMIADPEPVTAEAEDVLDLAEVAMVTGEPRDVEVAVPPPPEPVPEASFEPQAVDVDIEPVPAPMPMRSVVNLDDRILSETTGSVVGQAFQALSRHTAMPAAGRSLEDVVAELLRPMLRGWLDENLPAIVEKLVKTEIERVSRGG